MEDKGKERRRAERHRSYGAVTLSWMTGYGRTSCEGNSFDRSDSGILAEIPQPILAGTTVTVKISGSGEPFRAKVRHCRKHGAWYRIGLEFVAAPAKKAPAPAPAQEADPEAEAVAVA